ncbi:MAG: MipA/OmpV family protein [Rhodospirillaceae bacterium]|nr:MipA/OmpV family protein [Rhodospirillaceae bacterium]
MPSVTKTLAAAGLAALLIAFAVPVRAQTLDTTTSWFEGIDDWLTEIGSLKLADFQFSVGAGMGIAPDYLGADEYKPLGLPLFQIRYKDTLTVDPLGIRLRVWRSDCCRLRVVVGLAESRSANKGTAVSKLPKVDRGVNIGTTFEGRIVGPVAFRFNARQEVAGGHGGLTAAPSLGLVLGDRARTYTLIPEVALTWASGGYMDSFFTVTPAWSVTSGLLAFDAGAGFRDVAFRFTGTYRFDEDWSAVLRLQAAHLLNDAGRSPVTRPSGSRFQGLIGFGALYTF